MDAAQPGADDAAAGGGKTEEDGPAAADQPGFPAGHRGRQVPGGGNGAGDLLVHKP